jgi:hypothetical protein
MVSGLMKSVMSENHNNWSQVLVTALQYLRVQPRKRGLNSPFTCPEWRGGSHTLPNHVTGGGLSTRHSRRVITLRPGALLYIYFIFLNSSTPTKSIHYFCDCGRRYNQVRRRYRCSTVCYTAADSFYCSMEIYDIPIFFIRKNEEEKMKPHLYTHIFIHFYTVIHTNLQTLKL